MESYVVIQFGLILAEYVRALGMQAENMQRQVLGQPMAYTAEEFEDQARQLEYLANQLR